jgi:hypothetical protein
MDSYALALLLDAIECVERIEGVDLRLEGRGRARLDVRFSFSSSATICAENESGTQTTMTCYYSSL